MPPHQPLKTGHPVPHPRPKHGIVHPPTEASGAQRTNSRPPSRRKSLRCGASALLAQLVEHFHGKEGVAGSSPAEGSSESPAKAGLLDADGRVCGARRRADGHVSDTRRSRTGCGRRQPVAHVDDLRSPSAGCSTFRPLRGGSRGPRGLGSRASRALAGSRSWPRPGRNRAVARSCRGGAHGLFRDVPWTCCIQATLSRVPSATDVSISRGTSCGLIARLRVPFSGEGANQRVRRLPSSSHRCSCNLISPIYATASGGSESAPAKP